jgi:hypothetical protein
MDVFLSNEEFAKVIDNIIKESEGENKKRKYRVGNGSFFY